MTLVVIGAGLVGSAVSRRLAELGLDPVCFGPEGGPPYSSHDDSGRITRILDASPTWARLASRAIEGYPGLESRSGVRFHHPVGMLWSARAPGPLAELDTVKTMFDVEYEGGLGGWEGVAALADDEALLERGAAGYIAPREMRRAHRLLAERNGAVFDPRVAVAVEPVGGRWVIRLSDGETVTSDRVVVAAGAGTRDLVNIELDVTGEVVIDAFVPAPTGQPLARFPCIGRLTGDSVVEGYLTPPIEGALGWSIKFGAESAETVSLTTASDVAEWMSGQAHTDRVAPMSAALRQLLPGIDFTSVRSRPCIYTRTSTGLPIIDEVAPGLIVATGGNGRMAKSADAVAGLAARLAWEGTWDDHEFDASFFAV